MIPAVLLPGKLRWDTSPARADGVPVTGARGSICGTALCPILQLQAMDDLRHIHAPPALAHILKRTADLRFDMASEERTGALLRTLAASKPGGRFLELGTGTGIATAWLLDGMDSASRLISVDVDARFQEVAGEAFSQDERLTLVVEDAMSFLRSQPVSTFDF